MLPEIRFTTRAPQERTLGLDPTWWAGMEANVAKTNRRAATCAGLVACLSAACGGGDGGVAGTDWCANPMAAAPPYRGDAEHAYIVGCMAVDPNDPITGHSITDDEMGAMAEEICQIEYACPTTDPANPRQGIASPGCMNEELQVDTGLDWDGEHHGLQIELKGNYQLDRMAGLPRMYTVVPKGMEIPGMAIRVDGEIRRVFDGSKLYEEVGSSGLVTLHRFDGMPDPNGIIQVVDDPIATTSWVGYNFFVQFPTAGHWMAGSISAPCREIDLNGP